MIHLSSTKTALKLGSAVAPVLGLLLLGACPCRPRPEHVNSTVQKCHLHAAL